MNNEVSPHHLPVYKTVHQPVILGTFFKDIQKGDLKKVKMRLQPGSGTDINRKDTYSRTPLMYASTMGHIEIVKLLLEKGADINGKDIYSRTALMNASNNGNIEIVKLLLENNADINAKDRDGNTALINATDHGHIEIVKLLLEKGADVDAKNENDETAADLAHNEEIRKLLIDRKPSRKSMKSKSRHLNALNRYTITKQLKRAYNNSRRRGIAVPNFQRMKTRLLREKFKNKTRRKTTRKNVPL